MTLIPITIGVGVATVYDLSINMIGLGTQIHTFHTLLIILVSSFYSLIRSVCCACCGGHIDGSDFYQHVPEELELRRSTATQPHQSADHPGYAHHVPHVRQRDRTDGVPVHDTMRGSNRIIVCVRTWCERE